VAHATTLGLYPSLITSGKPLDRARLVALRDAGLEHVQVSFQSLDAVVARDVAGADFFDDKVRACAWAKELGLLLTVNVVLHRSNIGEVPAFIELAERLGADKLELANTQYLGWALENRDALIPTAAQVDEARRAVAERPVDEEALRIDFVLPDHHAGRPRRCMDGWARRYVVVTPDGVALPCHAARALPLPFVDVRQQTLSEQWMRGEAFGAFRGQAWMREPCRSCDHRHEDFGGCRCQAFELTGDASNTDPACRHSPFHALVEIRTPTLESDVRLLRRLPLAHGL
jgi:pyrroloquinoline quinone biosynthesis protein E